tara:strand:- start:308 stop:655 length:348 start_codon:yes stop_codon:yes gene_type:complete
MELAHVSYKKGALVLVSDGVNTSTCIILTEKFAVSSEKNYNFFYSYCLETGIYGIIYENEITSLVAPDFAPDFEFSSTLFDTDYAYHEAIFESFAYFPGIWSYDLSSEDDESEDK